VTTTLASARISLKNILFTTDFSSSAAAALPYLHALARWYGAKVCIAHVVPAEPRLSVPLDLLPAAVDRQWQWAERKMSALETNEWLKDIEHKQILRQGDLWYALSSIITQEHIDLLVTATHGREGLSKLFMGSSAEAIFRGARCPVLTVGPKVAGGNVRFENFKNILFATDFSAASLHALPYALSIAQENQARVIMAHIMTMVPYQHREAVVQDETKRLKALLPTKDMEWCQAEFAISFQFPAEGILEVAESYHADLIVMGVRHGDTPRLASHLPWTTAYDVVCGATCPVLTVRG
jgi:nucleotide-binding universal stress UspA family protein